jgi:hypothetical protein
VVELLHKSGYEPGKAPNVRKTRWNRHDEDLSASYMATDVECSPPVQQPLTWQEALEAAGLSQ